MNKELAKTLTTALVQFVDSERPEGSMCCSNTDCENIRAALEEGEYDCVEAFIQKKLSRLTEFENGLINFYNKRNEIPSDKDGVYNKHDLEEFLHESAKTLLALAKKELCNGCNANLEGYIKGQQDAKRRYDESVAYHFPIMPQRPLCYEPGGTCTNPHMDCINCPKRTTGGGFHTSSGTSTSKEEG